MPLEVSRHTLRMAGILLLAVPTIQYGGYFLLRSLTDRQSGHMENPLRQNFFRAGRAHAGPAPSSSSVSHSIPVVPDCSQFLRGGAR